MKIVKMLTTLIDGQVEHIVPTHKLLLHYWAEGYRVHYWGGKYYVDPIPDNYTTHLYTWLII